MVGTQVMLADTHAIMALLINVGEVMFPMLHFYTLELVLIEVRHEVNILRV